MTFLVAMAACTMTAPVGAVCPDVWFTEVMTANDTYLIDDVTADWFEIHNRSDADQDLSGYWMVGSSSGGSSMQT